MIDGRPEPLCPGPWSDVELFDVTSVEEAEHQGSRDEPVRTDEDREPYRSLLRSTEENHTKHTEDQCEVQTPLFEDSP